MVARAEGNFTNNKRVAFERFCQPTLKAFHNPPESTKAGIPIICSVKCYCVRNNSSSVYGKVVADSCSELWNSYVYYHRNNRNAGSSEFSGEIRVFRRLGDLHTPYGTQSGCHWHKHLFEGTRTIVCLRPFPPSLSFKLPDVFLGSLVH